MPNPRIQRVASLRRTVAISTLVVFMAVWGAVVKLGPGGAGSSSASTASTNASAASSSTTSGATSPQGSSSGDTASQASTPLTTSQS